MSASLSSTANVARNVAMLQDGDVPASQAWSLGWERGLVGVGEFLRLAGRSEMGGRS